MTSRSKLLSTSEAEDSHGLDVKGLRVSYNLSLWRKQKVLEGIDLEISESEGVLIVGPSGAGKTTLLRTLAGEIREDGGEVRSHGRILNRRKRSRVMAYVPENPRFSDRHTVEEVLYQWGGGTSRKKTSRIELLEELDLISHIKKPASSLSAGLSKRLAWAIALSKEGVEGFLLDEPVSSLDAKWQERILFYIGRELSRGRYAVIASHDSAKYFDLCSKQVQLKFGMIYELGNLTIPPSSGVDDGDSKNDFNYEMNHVFSMDIRGLSPEELAEMGRSFALRPWDDAREHASGSKLFFSDYGLASAWLGRLLGCGVVITQFDERLDQLRTKPRVDSIGSEGKL